MSRAQLVPTGPQQTFRGPDGQVYVLEGRPHRRPRRPHEEPATEGYGDETYWEQRYNALLDAMNDEFGDTEGDYGDTEGDYGDTEGDYGDTEGDYGDAEDRLEALNRREARHDRRVHDREARHDRRVHNREARHDARIDALRAKLKSKIKGNESGGKPMKKQEEVILSGRQTGINGADKSYTITIDQSNYAAFTPTDISFEGSTDEDALVTQVWAGGEILWNEENGISIKLFSANSTLRGILKNNEQVNVPQGAKIKVYIISGSGANDDLKRVQVAVVGKATRNRRSRC